MITRLQAKNFKSWKDTGELTLAPLTGLFGTNSSGKTSILQMLLLLKQTVESPDRRQVLRLGDPTSIVDLGTFSDLVYRHDLSAILSLSLAWRLPQALVINNPESEKEELFHINDLHFSNSISEKSGRLAVESFQYRFGSHDFGMQRKESRGDSDESRYELTHGDYPTKRSQGRPWPLPAPVKCYGFPDEAVGYYQNTGFLPDFVLAFEQVFSQMTYLGPLREYPQRSYVWAGEHPVDVGRRGDKAVAALLAAMSEKMKIPRLVKKRHRLEPIEARIAAWMKETDLIDSFELRPIAEGRKDYEVRVRKNTSSSEVLITDVGFGVSQILPVLVLCYYAPEHSTILLEQPEIHLHPSVQASLADVFIDVVKERHVQIILESHSEHLLRRLQRRIAEEQIGVDDTALYFCRMETDSSRIDRLDVDMFGNIRNWPKGFFGDEMGELSAMTEAAMRRQMAEIE